MDQNSEQRELFNGAEHMNQDSGQRVRPVKDSYYRNPPIWKDWIGFAGMIITISVVLLQGGRILESLDNTRLQLTSVVGVVTSLKEDVARVHTEMATQAGVDALHDERIRGLDFRITNMERRQK